MAARSLLRILSAGLVAGLLAGCAGIAPQPAQPDARPPRESIRGFSLDGRVSITRAAERAQANISWQHVRGTRDEIDLYSPVGSQLAHLTATPRGAELVTPEQRRYEAPDAESLSAQVLGAPLPLGGMPDWVLGRSTGQAVSEERDRFGRYTYLAETGWVIRYLDYETEAPEALPRTMDFERGDLRVRLRVDEWRDLR